MDSTGDINLDPIEEVIDDVRAGKLVIIVDDKDRENEGDLMVAAELVTPESINFMINEGKGLICVALDKEHIDSLAIPYQVTENTAPLGTNFTVSVDHKSVADHGVSASARATTIKEMVNPEATPEDFVRPGFVFPLCAVEGGVFRRTGQTEGSVDLSSLAGLKPAGVICEVMDEQGVMLCGLELQNYCRQYGLKVTSVNAIAQYRLQNEVSIRQTAECELEDVANSFCPDIKNSPSLKVKVFLDESNQHEEIVFVVGEPKEGALVRIHSECLTGDVFSSQRCDCGQQFDQALAAMFREGSGVLVYLDQEGRGIGLANKLRAYRLQEQGFDTVDANVELGFDVDSRDFLIGARILKNLELNTVRLMTNNLEKVKALEKFGVHVRERVELEAEVTEHNRMYLQAKKQRLGHLLKHLDA